MAVENLAKTISYPVSESMANQQYRFMTLESGGQVHHSSDGGDAIGILQDDPAAADRAGNVMVGYGESKVEAGGVCTLGGYAASDALGRAVDAVSGDIILGWFSREAAAAAGEIITVLFQKGAASL
jgi:hypothetical protein